MNHYVFPVNCIQTFVYLVTPLIQCIKEADITSNIRLESGIKLWQALWECRQPDIFCFAAPVKPRKYQLTFVPLLKKTMDTAGAHDIYIGGDEDEGPPKGPTRPSLMMIPQISRQPLSLGLRQSVVPASSAASTTKPISSATEGSQTSPSVLTSTTESRTRSQGKKKKPGGKPPVIRSVSEYKKKRGRESKAVSGTGERENNKEG